MQASANRTLRIIAVVLTSGLIVLALYWPSVLSFRVDRFSQEQYESEAPSKHSTSVKQDDRSRRPCEGIRGTLLDDDTHVDLPKSLRELPGIPYPKPTFGSYEALRLGQEWTTFEQRYGPYGYSSTNGQQHTDAIWSGVDWGALQNKCFDANRARFQTTGLQQQAGPRFRHFNPSEPDEPRRPHKTGRQAIILRTLSTYKYYPEDFWNLRSIITETALATNGNYHVFLLVDLKCGEACADVFTNSTRYNEVLQDSVPSEFRSIAVLVHENLQRSWYPKVGQYWPYFQIMQPLQLFAHFYPEFDHYWQFEMDTRFTGHVGRMLQAFDTFGMEQPYKQARERASWMYMESVHGSYEDFSKKVNKSLKGGATIWGADRIKSVEPIGPLVPPDPKDDDFQFGVGHDADLLLFGQLNDVRLVERLKDWVFRNWSMEAMGKDTPIYMSTPAQARASYELLEAIHRSQHNEGLRVASEATLPSWALWLGLKVVGLPIPRSQYPERDHDELGEIFNGGLPEQSGDGIARGPGVYRAASYAPKTRPLTLDWWSSLCDPIFEHWMGQYESKDQQQDVEHPENVVVPNEMPWFMKEVDGKIYMPEMILHPRKTNRDL
ncbi:hypothetical protein CKM354_000659800 [Cercospora kikuchii]|uniref:Uncharacterized protein n=1 Tax=Cercospora kikuchii TaxID=84275 RepID=A0A9P3FDJ9_9PEZI|nr:uncharacterized protein CKM354_000659800 [Cercospora kikuchii]GIZ43368.1 hypothetical protein CKM354_000659800 [Cercospora kikuchii]